MADSYSWTIASPVTSYGNCYGPATTSHGARCFCAAAGNRYAVHCACAADDRLPVNFSHDQYYDSLPQQQQQQQQQELAWFSVRNMLIPLNVGTTTTGMTTTVKTQLDSRRDDNITGSVRDILGVGNLRNAKRKIANVNLRNRLRKVL